MVTDLLDEYNWPVRSDLLSIRIIGENPNKPNSPLLQNRLFVFLSHTAIPDISSKKLFVDVVKGFQPYLQNKEEILKSLRCRQLYSIEALK